MLDAKFQKEEEARKEKADGAVLENTDQIKLVKVDEAKNEKVNEAKKTKWHKVPDQRLRRLQHFLVDLIDKLDSAGHACKPRNVVPPSNVIVFPRIAIRSK
jgi:hypothetical protein